MAKVHSRRVVIKVGTGVLTLGVGQLNAPLIGELCNRILKWQEVGHEVLLVSSGAVGLGMGSLGMEHRPVDMPTLQACAAIGQSSLVETWKHGFDQHGVLIAQVLLTRDDLRSRQRHVGVRDTLEKLLSRGVVPIINENDTVSYEEIKFGDNDVLSALVASLVNADTLIILSTVAGLMDREVGGALVPVVDAITPEIETMAGGTQSATAVGGMASKIESVKVASQSDCGVFIADGAVPENLDLILAGKNPGTFFVPSSAGLKARKRWLAFFQDSEGALIVDEGARKALIIEGGSLLAKGICGVRDSFKRETVVRIECPEGEVFARGICPFSSEEIQALMGEENSVVRDKFPGVGKGEVVHRDSLALCR